MTSTKPTRKDARITESAMCFKAYKLILQHKLGDAE